MNTEKIVGIVGVLVAIVGAFVAIPQMATILLVAGLIVGIFVIGDHHVRVMVTALRSAASVWTTRMPRPPPPPDALMITG